MRAAIYESYSRDFDTLKVLEVEEPKLMAGSVLIEVRAAGVNPVDWKLMAGDLDDMIDPHFPVIPGWDVAGVVIDVGFDVPEFNVGDEVLAYARKDGLGLGSFAERIAVLASAVTIKPAELSWEQAAGLPLAGGTALRAIDTLGELDGRTLLVHAAAGGVGSLAVQIAIARGARVLGTASLHNHDFLRGYGVEPLEHGPGLVERVLALAGGAVSAVADFYGGQLETTLAVLQDDGAHVSIADGSVVHHGGRYVWVRPDGSETARLVEMVKRKELTVEVAECFTLECVPAAFRASQSGRTRGKLVVKPQM